MRERSFQKVAVIADQMISFGGADREMFSMLELFPNADIFTIAFNSKAYGDIKQKVHTSFVQRIPKPKSFYRHLKVLTPLAYESFDLREYDLVISISAGPARGVITGIDQPHIAMVMTPPRSLWDNELNVRASKFKKMYRAFSTLINTYMRIWDLTISKRVDYWTANSKYIAKKIKKRYGVEATVISPGIQKDSFEEVSDMTRGKVREKFGINGEFVLVVSRLYDYKRIDWAIRACIESNKQLVIIGEGPDIKYLKSVANGNSLIKFLGFLKDDADVRVFYNMAEVLLFCGIEDFGLVPVEAMAQGTPVLAYGEGGVLETVTRGVCGDFFSNEKELVNALKKFDNRGYNSTEIVNRAREFSEEIFLDKLDKYIKKIYDAERDK
ncbi:MAG: glycosyltransferase [Candidatus Dojkabacteria bacterium]|jgi:glycosyltransferase involved in cell wall biosynthesis|nr:glycosyltransferase [Candidatus Dojkabacteria bacterium]